MMLTAHSGCDHTGMNSMEFLEYAAGMPVDALEIDIRRMRDGTLALAHDPAEDGSPVTLEAAFRFLSAHDVRINCDLKQPGLGDDVLACAARCGVDEGRIIFTGVMTDCVRRHPGARAFVNAEELMPGFDGQPVTPERTEELIRRCGEEGYKVVNLDYRICDARFMEACAKAGIGLSLWTVDDPELVRAFRDAGAANVTTRRVAEACRLLSLRREE